MRRFCAKCAWVLLVWMHPTKPLSLSLQGRRPPGPAPPASEVVPAPRTSTRPAILGRASSSGPSWSASPRRSPRSPYRARSRGVDASADASEFDDHSRGSSCKNSFFRNLVTGHDDQRSVLGRNSNPRTHPSNSGETCKSKSGAPVPF